MSGVDGDIRWRGKLGMLGFADGSKGVLDDPIVRTLSENTEKTTSILVLDLWRLGV